MADPFLAWPRSGPTLRARHRKSSNGDVEGIAPTTYSSPLKQSTKTANQSFLANPVALDQSSNSSTEYCGRSCRSLRNVQDSGSTYSTTLPSACDAGHLQDRTVGFRVVDELDGQQGDPDLLLGSFRPGRTEGPDRLSARRDDPIAASFFNGLRARDRASSANRRLNPGCVQIALI